MAKADLARTGSTIRCAIYTRKSSDEGLEQEFNSLDAQREAGRKPKLLLLVQIDQKIVPEFFSALMTHFTNHVGRLRANSDDGAYSFMNTTALKHLRIYVPSLPLQEEFAKRVIGIRKLGANKEPRKARCAVPIRAVSSVCWRIIGIK